MRTLTTTLLAATLLAAPYTLAFAQDATPAAKAIPAKPAAAPKKAPPKKADQLAAAKSKCDAMSGDAKDRCVTEAQTRYGTTSVSAGQTAYYKNGAMVVRNSKDLPAGSAATQRTSKDLGDTKMPSNQPTDIAKAAAEAKRKAGN